MPESIISPGLILYILAWLIGTLLLWRIENLNRTAAPADLKKMRRISIIIPARNEETRLGALLNSLEQQKDCDIETILVDDHSTDNTSRLALQKGLRVIPSQTLPEGWSGKNWVCWQGAQAAQGDVLLFLDADTWLLPGGVARLLSAWQQTGGLLTVQPDHLTQKAYEQLSAFFNLVLMASINAFTVLGKRLAPGGGFGPCVMCSRADYFAAGGHSNVRNVILESIPLVRNFIRMGLPVRCLIGRGAIAFRMYPGGYQQLLEGWSKGFGKGAVMVNPIFTILASIWITGCFGAFSQTVRLLITGQIWILAVYAAYALQIAWMLYRIGRWQVWTVILFPIPLTFFALVMLRSLVLNYIIRRVSWHGRSIPTQEK